MPMCKDCGEHFLNHPSDIAGWHSGFARELPPLYHRTPTCPKCGLIGNVKKSILRDGLSIIKAETGDPEVISGFMAFYRKRHKDFKDGDSIARAFLDRL